MNRRQRVGYYALHLAFLLFNGVFWFYLLPELVSLWIGGQS